MERYLVFAYSTYYPEGGMNDCALKTDHKGLAQRTADALLDNGQHVHILDTHTGEITTVVD
jgi:hypothetical protein